MGKLEKNRTFTRSEAGAAIAGLAGVGAGTESKTGRKPGMPGTEASAMWKKGLGVNVGTAGVLDDMWKGAQGCLVVRRA